MTLTGIFINAFTMSFSLYSWIPLMAMAASITRPFWKLRVHIPYLIIINHIAAKKVPFHYSANHSFSDTCMYYDKTVCLYVSATLNIYCRKTAGPRIIPQPGSLSVLLRCSAFVSQPLIMRRSRWATGCTAWWPGWRWSASGWWWFFLEEWFPPATQSPAHICIL